MNKDKAFFLVATLLLLVLEIKMILTDGRAAIPIFATLCLCVSAIGLIDDGED